MFSVKQAWSRMVSRLWQQTQIFLASDPSVTSLDTNNSNFGISIATYAATMIVGQPVDRGSSRGLIHIFVRPATVSEWEPTTRITPFSESNNRAGYAVDMYDDRTVIIGCPDQRRTSPFQSNAGAVSVWISSSPVWLREADLYASDSEQNDRFGSSVAVSKRGFSWDTVLVVGAPYKLTVTGIPQAGAVYIFRRNRNSTTWTQEYKIEGTAAYQYIGTTVSITPYGDSVWYIASNTGAQQYVYSSSAWSSGVLINQQNSQRQVCNRISNVTGNSSSGSIVLSWTFEQPFRSNLWGQTGAVRVIEKRSQDDDWYLSGYLYPGYTGSFSIPPTNQSLFFGTSVVNNGSQIIISQPGNSNDPTQTDVARVYVFSKQSDGQWLQEDIVAPNSKAPSSLRLGGDYRNMATRSVSEIIAGIPGADSDGFTDNGGFYAFQRTNVPFVPPTRVPVINFVATALNTDVVAISHDSMTWLTSTMPAVAEWRSVAYGNGTWVAIASNSDFVATSTDGRTWTQRNMPNSRNWTSIAYGNDRFVITAYNSSVVAVSTDDGETWTEHNILTGNNDWYDITYGSGASALVFVAIVRSNTVRRAATSSDGVTWTERTLPAFATWQCIGYSPTAGFLAVAYNSSIAATSGDGIVWTQRTLPRSDLWIAICVYPYATFRTYIVMAQNKNNVVITTDGINWSNRTLNPKARNWTSIAASSDPAINGLLGDKAVIAAVAANSWLGYTSYSGYDNQLVPPGWNCAMPNNLAWNKIATRG